MSIVIDDRESTDLVALLTKLALPVSVCRLDFGDCAIQASNGLLIGYERKKLDDICNSMLTRRASWQLKNMRDSYDRVELVIESLYRAGPNDSIEVPVKGQGWSPYFWRGKGISYRQLDSFLYSQVECGGIRIWRTGFLEETARLYASRWYWWQKDYELHSSHDVIYSNEPSQQHRGAVMVHQGEPNPVTKLAAQIPGIDSKAWDVGKYFPSPIALTNADESEWRKLPWTDRKGNVKHFGRESARAIVQWMRGEKR